MPPPPHFRALARKKLELSAIVRLQRKTWERDARIVDIGLGGACVELRDPPDQGTDVVLEIRTPTLWDPLILQGIIAWSSRPPAAGTGKLGIRFTHKGPAALLGLFELLGAHGFDP